MTAREGRGPVLVVGATGRQGGSALRNLMARGWSVRALVRDPRSRAATDLAARGADLCPGDLDDADSLRAALRGSDGVFSVQTPLTAGGIEAEERHGTLLADVAAEVGVRHYVHSSVGGAERPDGVAWRESKLRIEQRVRERGLPATFIRPTYFMDNFSMYPPLLEGGELVYRRALEPGRTLQMIASRDIGFFVAEAFDDPRRWIGECVELAGDELTGDQIAAVFQRHTGIPTRFDPIPVERLRATSEWQATAYSWLNRIGYRADIPALRRRCPELLDLQGWLAECGWAPSPEHAAPPAAGVPRRG